jgi:methylphosphotriester-DNA--protein-cysteine methyltransferase
MVASRSDAEPPDRLVCHAARVLATAPVRTDALAGEFGLSERQFRRRCHAAVGYGPKTLHRILRFRRFVSYIDAVEPARDLSRIAVETGYADQAHLTRDSVRLAGLPPAALARVRRGGQVVRHEAPGALSGRK